MTSCAIDEIEMRGGLGAYGFREPAPHAALPIFGPAFGPNQRRKK